MRNSQSIQSFDRYLKLMGSTSKSVKIRTASKIRILICSSDASESRRMVYFFNTSGFEARAVGNYNDLMDITLKWRPRVVIADLLLTGANAFEYLNFLRSETRLAKTAIATLVISSHDKPHNVDEAFRRGAADYIVRPVNYPDLLNRVILQCRETRDLNELIGTDEQAAQWQMTEVLLTQAMSRRPLEEILHNLTRMAAKKVGGIRCSVVRTVTMSEATVIASSDDARISGLKIDLNKYPEIRLVVNSGKTIVIDDLANSRTLSAIKKATKSIVFNSMIVSPLYYKGHTFGALSMRLPESKKKISDADLRFIEMLSKMISLTLSAQDLKEISKFGLIPA